MTNDVVWTGWLSNPGDGQCPVPEWVKSAQAWFRGLDSSAQIIDQRDANALSWAILYHNLDITHYRYAIPADLAWLAENVDGWKFSNKEYVAFDPVWEHAVWCHRDTTPYRSWHRDNWLRARKDLGYDVSHHISQNSKEEPMTKAVDQCRLEMLNSFYSAVVEAGGDPKTIIRMDMTLEEIIGALAQNGIRFYYDKANSAGRK